MYTNKVNDYVYSCRQHSLMLQKPKRKFQTFRKKEPPCPAINRQNRVTKKILSGLSHMKACQFHRELWRVHSVTDLVCRSAHIDAFMDGWMLIDLRTNMVHTLQAYQHTYIPICTHTKMNIDICIHIHTLLHIELHAYIEYGLNHRTCMVYRHAYMQTVIHIYT